MWKIKFIDDYINKIIIIERKKKSEIIEQLENLKYPKLNSNYKAEEKDKNYNYIIDIKLFDLTEEKISELTEKMKKKKKKLEIYESTKYATIWKNELLELKEAYILNYPEITKDKKKVIKKRQPRTKKQ